MNQYPNYDKTRGVSGRKPNEDSFVQWMDTENELSWDEFKDDKKVKDESEWHDVDFAWTQQHPDWGMDDKVKDYFKKASSKKIMKPVEFLGDSKRFEEKYHLAKVNETKKAEADDRYDYHPAVEVQREREALKSGETARKLIIEEE